MHSAAAAPSRATTSVTVAYGPLTIRCSVYTGTEATAVVRKEFVKGDPTRPVGRASTDKLANTIIDTADVVRMAQASDGTWVEVTDPEIAACTTPGVAQITAFVGLGGVGRHYVTEGCDQLRPKREKGKVNPADERAFGLLMATMKSKGVGALVKVASRGPARWAILTPDGFLRYVKPVEAVRAALPMPEATYSDDEVALMGSLIDAVGVSFPAITDETAAQVAAFVDAKAKVSGVAVEAEAPEALPDIMDTLAASIAAAKAKKAS